MNADELKSRIRQAFGNVEYPGDWCLRASDEGEEPFLLEDEFKGKSDWSVLKPKFLDQAPDGFSSALSFFSDEAFRFYLPAYLIADIDGGLESTQPVWYLCHGLLSSSRHDLINPRRYGQRTDWDYAVFRLSVFDVAQCNAIVDYLQFMRSQGKDEWMIDEAIANYWLTRAKRTE